MYRKMKKISSLFTALLIVAGAAAMAPKDSLKPYATVIPSGAITSAGFITVHQVSGRYFFEIPDSIFDRDLFTVNRITQSPQDWRNPLGGLCSYGNDWIGQSMFRFVKGTGDKVLLKVISTSERDAPGEKELDNALKENSLMPVYASFPIQTFGKEQRSVVIDVTDYLNSDNAVFGYLAGIKMLAMPGNFVPDRSFITSVKAYPLNIEVASTRTYAAGVTTLTGEYNSSIILLPQTPMHGRRLDERVGFFGILPADFKQLNGNGTISQEANIWRWRLEPKPEDREKYFRGELVEPQQPIIFYIDPATPRKWVPYLIAGVNDWQAAFEKAGFKNAIIAKEVDPADTTFDISDARHNVIVYKASAIGNAMGHSLQDPRSGEIIESHIQWYHSVMEILYKWYLTQAGAVDTAAQKPAFSDELMGQLIRFVSSHEVGHAVGLRHNWGASSTTTIAQLRNKEWVEAHGHTPSIMDYARFNYVAQPEDHISEKGLFPRIGDYDQWAVQWGYQLLPENTNAAQEKELLNKWVVDKLKTSDRYRFGIGDDPAAPYPDNQREDMGDDAMEAGTYGIKNLQRILPNLQKWVQVPGDSYNRLEDVYKALVAQYEWYIKHVTANIGGRYFTPKTVEQEGDIYSFFSKEKQQRAMAFLQQELFTTPEWLRDNQLYQLTKTDFSIVEDIQRKTIRQLLDPKLFDKLRAAEVAGVLNAYTVTDLLTSLHAAIFSGLETGAGITSNSRMQQKVYVSDLAALINIYKDKDSDAGTVLKEEARQLMEACKDAALKKNDELEKAHLTALYEMLYTAVSSPLKLAKANEIN